MEKIKLLLADDHQLIIDGVRSLLEDVNDIDIVGEASNGKLAIEKLREIDVDVILMDIHMPVMNGYEATGKIIELYPDIKIIALTMYDEKFIISRMMEAGASGYILKNIGKESLREAVKTVHNGGEYFSSEIPIILETDRTEDKLPLNDTTGEGNKVYDLLSKREIEILQLITQGLSSNEISKRLNRSYKTVDTHRTNIMKKLGIHNIAGLVRYAMENQLI